MAMPLASLPQEILRLVVSILQGDDHEVILPLAQTYNRAIYSVCLDFPGLNYYRSTSVKHKVICDHFQEDFKYGWGWTENHHLDMRFLPLKGTLAWLDDLAVELHDQEFIDDDFGGITIFHMDQYGRRVTVLEEVTRMYDQYRNSLTHIACQVDAVGCRLPASFLKFYERLYFYQRLFPMLREELEPPRKARLHKVHPREGITGYYLEFLGCAFTQVTYCLYLDPGPAKAHAVIQTMGCDWNWDWLPPASSQAHSNEEYLPCKSDLAIRELFEVIDSHGHPHQACHELDFNNKVLLATDFEVWLATMMFEWTATRWSDWYRSVDDHVGKIHEARHQEFINANPRIRR